MSLFIPNVVTGKSGTPDPMNVEAQGTGGKLVNPEMWNENTIALAQYDPKNFSPANSVSKDDMMSSLLKGLQTPLNYFVDAGAKFGAQIFAPAQKQTTAVPDGISNVDVGNDYYVPSNKVKGVSWSFTDPSGAKVDVIIDNKVVGKFIGTAVYDIYDQLRGAVQPENQDSRTGVMVKGTLPNLINSIPQALYNIVYANKDTSPTSGYVNVTKQAGVTYAPVANEKTSSAVVPSQFLLFLKNNMTWLIILVLLLIMFALGMSGKK